MISTFKYIWFPPSNPESSLRPIIKTHFAKEGKPLAQKASGRIVGYDSLVDSGSDKTISFVEIGNKLGINFEDPKLSRGVKALGIEYDSKIEGLSPTPIPVYITPMDVIVNNRYISGRKVHWIKHDMTDSDFPVILGQDTVFETFDIHFSKRQKCFYLNSEKFSPKKMSRTTGQ